ncbi:MAG: sigma-70 family RNA polymerase sigma factor [Candidatus Omnitrophica bacterium]|nr:sigma-70 family RNA polymerase sigma factor [Candidatus Omnitrophota bacterium]MCM8817267.1 sigma-70 family RNA polymerase sigma factor [Candidatus Omnitrophota bacterium]
MNKEDICHLDDTHLVKIVQDGNDIAAFEILVRRYQDMVYNICFRFMGQKEEALDCSQETFIKVYENIKRFKHLSSFRTWIYRIAVNTCKNHLSSRRFRNQQKTDYISEKMEIGSSFESPEVYFEKQRLQKIVQDAIDKLPLDQKQLIILRDIQQLSYQEIREITKLPEGTIKSKISRAREKLKELLKDIKNGM